ncbi:MAG: hypothetical protein HOP28_03030 [Gemmatimonadales bacterium]|nr:hypothetical protein [Gemmatimonadales bacterium]
MRFSSRVFALVASAFAVAGPTAAQQVRSDAPVAEIRDNRFKWFFGAQTGAMIFETQAQTRTGLPAFGAHLSIVSRRGGLIIGVDEAFGNNESSAFVDSNAGVTRAVTFDRLRRYGFSLTGYPVRGSLEPYLGVGFGFLQVVSPQVDDVFTSPADAAASADDAHEKSATGFMSFLAGVQFRVGRLAAFGQYQISSSPSEGNLLRGTGHSIMGGLRFSLGSTKQEIKGGGY